MAFKDLTVRLFGKDVSASAAFNKLSRNVEGLERETEKAAAVASAAGDKQQRAYQQTARAAEASALKQAAALKVAADARSRVTGRADEDFSRMGAIVAKQAGIVGESAESAATSFAPLIAAAAAVAPALIPIAAVGAGALLTLGLGAKGAVAQFKQLSGVFGELQAAAAKSLAPGIQSLIDAVKVAEPQLLGLVRLFGSAISKELTKLANSGAIQAFVGYAERELPIVIDLFENVTKAAVKVGQALTPLGNAVLRDFDDMAKSISGAIDLFQKAAGAIGKINSAIDDLANKAIPGLGNVSKQFRDLQNPFEVTHRAVSSLGDLFKGHFSDALNDVLGKEKQQKQQVDESAEAVKTLNDVLGAQAGNYGITSDQALNLVGVLGITKDTIDSNSISATKLGDAVADAAGAFNLANTADSQFLGSLQTFASSAGTAADRAKLIGATLVEANGDALGFQTTMNNASVAEKNLGDAMATAASQVGQNGESVNAYIRSIVDLKTGTIDYNNAAAAPLLQGLGQLKDAGEKAAEATFQHEVKTKGATKAADDAYNVYAKFTRGALTDQAKQLGLVDGQGHALTGTIGKLADGYFGLPKDVKTKLEQEGADPIKTILQDIDTTLKQIAQGASFTVTANVTPAEQALTNLQYKLEQVGAGGVPNVGILARGFAGGTTSAPGGWSWVGEQGPELMKLPAGTAIKPHPASLALAGGGGGSTVVVNQYVQGSVIRENELGDLARSRIDQLRRRNGKPSILNS